MKKFIFIPILFCLTIFTLAGELANDADQYWPQWRGPKANGNAEQNNPPTEWSETKNIKWKIQIPGKGSSSPIIWEDQIFITTAVPTGKPAQEKAPEASSDRSWMRGVTPAEQQFVVMAVSRKDGSVLWQKTVHHATPHAGTHDTGTWASNSPVTDGSHIYAYFGSQGLYCLDMAGNLMWQRDFGEMDKKMSFGEGSSPILYDDKLMIIWDHEGPSFLYVLDKNTGEEKWKIERDETTSWSSPLVVEHNGSLQVITSATKAVRSYDLNTGKMIWHASGMTQNVIPTPVELDGLVIVMSGFRGNSAMAIRLNDAHGDITDSGAIAWKLGRDTPYTPSPLLYGDTLYFLKSNSSVLSSANARNGEMIFSNQRLEGLGSVYASPVGAGGNVYITDRDGNTAVIRHSSQFEVLAVNSLDDGFDASAAIVEDEIFLRGQRNLYCIAD